MNKHRSPYTAMVQWSNEDKCYIARSKELEGCVAHGDTEQAAINMLRDNEKLWIKLLPAPIPESHDLPSGKWLQRVSRGLHLSIREAADKSGVSINQWVAERLAEAVGRGPVRCTDCGQAPNERGKKVE